MVLSARSSTADPFIVSAQDAAASSLLPANAAAAFRCARYWRVSYMNPDIQQRAARVRLLLMDVDGVLTDGRLFNVPGPDGKMAETKGFDSQDGIALQWMNWYGIKTGLISGRVSPATDERAKQT